MGSDFRAFWRMLSPFHFTLLSDMLFFPVLATEMMLFPEQVFMFCFVMFIFSFEFLCGILR